MHIHGDRNVPNLKFVKTQHVVSLVISDLVAPGRTAIASTWSYLDVSGTSSVKFLPSNQAYAMLFPALLVSCFSVPVPATHVAERDISLHLDLPAIPSSENRHGGDENATQKFDSTPRLSMGHTSSTVQICIQSRHASVLPKRCTTDMSELLRSVRSDICPKPHHNILQCTTSRFVAIVIFDSFN